MQTLPTRIFTAFFCGLITLSVVLPADRKAAYRFHYKGALFYAEGQVKEANQYFRKAYRIIPGNFYFAISYGMTQGQNGQTSDGLEIIAEARRAIAYDDPEVDRKRALSDFFSGMVYAFNQDYGAAYQAIASARHQLPESDEESHSIFENTLGYLRVHNQAKNAHQRGEMPDHYHVHRRDLKEALQHFERALQHNPHNPSARYNYKMMCDTLGVVPKFAINPVASDLKQEEERNRQTTFIDMHTRLTRQLELDQFEELLFLVDISGSMVQEKVLCMGDNRFDVMKTLARRMLETFPENQQYGFATIGGTCQSEPDFWQSVGTMGRDELDTRFRFLIPDGTTPLLSRIIDSPELFSDSLSTRKTIFLISDGANTCRVGGVDICRFAQELAQQGITVNILTFLSTNLNNTNAFAEYICLAESTGGNIIYMDNYHCRLEPLSFDLVQAVQLTLPQLKKSTCWGPHIKTLWNLFPSKSGE